MGCGVKQLSPDEYLTWVAEEGEELSSTRQIGVYIYQAKYLPVELQVLDQLDRPFDESKMLEEIANRKGNLSFQILIQTLDKNIPALKYGLEDASMYKARMDYLIRDMKRDLFLIRDNDTLNASLFHFEQTYDLAPYISCLVSFEDNTKPYKDQFLVFNDQHFGSGPLKFPFPLERLEQLPQLKIR